MSVTRPAASVELVKVQWVANVELDEQAVHIAVIASGAPGDDDWVAAAWLGTAATFRTAAVLAGPGTEIDRDAGTYAVYSRLTDDPEAPVILAGTLILT